MYWAVSVSVVSYPLDLVSLCRPHAAVLLWVLLCVCGVSAVHLHPHDRLKEKVSLISIIRFNLGVEYLALFRLLTSIVLDVVNSDVRGYKWCAVVFFLVSLFCQKLCFCLLCLDNVLYLCTRKEITYTSCISTSKKQHSFMPYLMQKCSFSQKTPLAESKISVDDY